MLIAGLVDWIGRAPPTDAAIAGRKAIAQGEIHLRCIWETGGVIEGHRPLTDDGIEPGQFLSEPPGKGCSLMVGYALVRRATLKEQQSLPVFSTWGYLSIRQKAEAHAQRAA
jgi:hypothetical protein